MLSKVLLFASTIFLCAMNSDSFKSEQLRYPRVRQAYANKEERMNELLKDASINQDQMNIYLRAFKQEMELELWGKNESDAQFKLIKTYQVCQTTGELGPKRQQGDMQIPEGFYHIDRFNPYSNFYLSLGLNYPNTSDRILGVKGDLGGDIFIHGDCVTIGCLPMTDELIKEIYIFCVEARNNGQDKIPVTVFPAKLNERKVSELIHEFDPGDQVIGLWSDLQMAYEHFNKHKQLPSIKFIDSGRHQIGG